MRPGPNKRMRGRNNNNGNRRNPNPLSRSYDSNGPDVKVRGTAQHVAERYVQLARDAQSSGDPVLAESYYQHAEHYFRLIAAAHEHMQQHYGGGFPRQDGGDDDDYGDDEPFMPGGQQEPGLAPSREQGYAGQGQPPAPAPLGDGQPGGYPPRGEQQRGERQFDRNRDRDRGSFGGQRGGRPFEPRGDRPEREDRPFDRNRDRGFAGPRAPLDSRPEFSPPPNDPAALPQPEVSMPAFPTRTEERRPEGERFERGPRRERFERFNRDRGPRVPETTPEEAPGLPSFITTPTRAPVVESPAPDSTPEPVAAIEGDATKPRRRRRGRADVAEPAGDPE